MRAQASLEFLVTYGWAIALIVVTLSWIAYMGFTDPTGYAGDDCRVSGEFGCQEAKLSAPSTLSASEASFVLRNLQPEKISVQEVIVEYDSQEYVCTRIQSLDGSDLSFVRSGEEFEVLCDDNNLQLVGGQKAKLGFTITYNSSVGFPKKASGEIVGLVDDSQTEIPHCGDGSINNDEDCDDGDDNGVVCTPSYGSSCDYCSSNCETVTLQGGFCGDGKVEPIQEQCDDRQTGGDLDGCTDSCEYTQCSTLVEKNGGCSELGEGEIPQPFGDNSCMTRDAPACVSCAEGYSWDADANDCVASCVNDPKCESTDSYCGVDGRYTCYTTSDGCLAAYSDPCQSFDCDADVCVCKEGFYGGTQCVPKETVDPDTCSVDGDCKEFAKTCESGNAVCAWGGSCSCTTESRW